MSEPVTAYRYAADLLRIVDADTQIYRVDLGYRCSYTASHRLLGLDTPEKSTPEGVAAHDYVTRWFLVNAKAGKVTLHSRKPADADKYGRWLALVVGTTGRCLNRDLLSEGIAQPYG